MTAEYLRSHLREQLAHEAGELGIGVDIVDGRLVLTGVVATPERRELAGRIARAMCEDHPVVNEIRVQPPECPAAPERLT
jgi:osmotically-inducible protein OsmY